MYLTHKTHCDLTIGRKKATARPYMDDLEWKRSSTAFLFGW